jgi:hypothetical protein
MPFFPDDFRWAWPRRDSLYRQRVNPDLLDQDAALREQARWQETLANRVRREVEWLRRGPKARTTRKTPLLARSRTDV